MAGRQWCPILKEPTFGVVNRDLRVWLWPNYLPLPKVITLLSSFYGCAYGRRRMSPWLGKWTLRGRDSSGDRPHLAFTRLGMNLIDLRREVMTFKHACTLRCPTKEDWRCKHKRIPFPHIHSFISQKGWKSQTNIWGRFFSIFATMPPLSIPTWPRWKWSRTCSLYQLARPLSNQREHPWRMRE